MNINERYELIKQLHDITIYFVSGHVRTFKIDYEYYELIADNLLSYRVPLDRNLQNRENIDPYIEFEYWTTDDCYNLKSHSIIVNMDNIETVE